MEKLRQETSWQCVHNRFLTFFKYPLLCFENLIFEKQENEKVSASLKSVKGLKIKTKISLPR